MSERYIPIESGARDGLEGPIERGRALLRAWTSDGTLLRAEAFAIRRGITPDLLPLAEGKGELFSVSVDGTRYYVAELLKFDPATASAICVAMADMESTAKLLFLLRRHGALAGRTIAEAACLGQAARVAELAEDWADECAGRPSRALPAPSAPAGRRD